MNWKSMLLLVGILAVAVSAVVPTITMPKSNCGGNSAALSEVRHITRLAMLSADDAADHTFRFGGMDEQQRKEFTDFLRESWVHGAHFLVSLQPIARTGAEDRKIVVVCDKPYNNVPERTFFSAPYTHAVCYSDDSFALVSTKEFAALDLSNFKALDELLPPPDK